MNIFTKKIPIDIQVEEKVDSQCTTIEKNVPEKLLKMVNAGNTEKIDMLCKLFIIHVFILFSIFIYCKGFKHGADTEEIYNKEVKEFEVSLYDDLKSGRDFILYNEFKLYSIKESKNIRHYRRKK
jgi:hypothetical protein